MVSNKVLVIPVLSWLIKLRLRRSLGYQEAISLISDYNLVATLNELIALLDADVEVESSTHRLEVSEQVVQLDDSSLTFALKLAIVGDLPDGVSTREMWSVRVPVPFRKQPVLMAASLFGFLDPDRLWMPMTFLELLEDVKSQVKYYQSPGY